MGRPEHAAPAPTRPAGRYVGRFFDSQRAQRALEDIGLDDSAADQAVVDAITEVADPDLAVTTLARLVERAEPGERRDLLAVLRGSDTGRRRLLAVLGGSAALGDILVRRPGQWRVLADDGLATSRPTRAAMGQQLIEAVAASTGRESYDALRVGYQRFLLTLAARDLSGELAVEDVAGELADLAEATMRAAVVAARADTEPPEDVRLAVIGLGKCGGRELNYVSDVDVLFVAEPGSAASAATAWAAATIRACSTVTAEGAIWTVDAGLRPEGRDGPLVRTLASHQGYYDRWAKTWEFQALLKARPIAGDDALGQAFVDAVSPLVWTAAGRPGFVDDVQTMRRRVLANLPADEADRELKLGRGGLRDVEFAVQLLQMVHGRGDPAVRSPNTLLALRALADGGYVGRDDAHRLDAAYRFLRTVEHRLQLQHLRRTHLLPLDPDSLRWLARAMDFRAVEDWRAAYDDHVREVRRIHEKLFYRPLLRAVARLPADEVRLTPEAAEQRLEALGFADPTTALRHLEALTSGVGRSAAILRTLLPAMLEWFADAADPDAGLLSFRQVSDALGTTPWYLRVLRDEGVTAQRLARLLATSRYVADLLGRAPETVALLADDAELRPRPASALHREFTAAVRRNEDWEDSVLVARGLRRRELLRIARGDLLGLSSVSEVGLALSDVTAATLSSALETASRKVAVERRAPLPVRLAVIAMGRLGGMEQGYGSDADVMFVCEPDPDEPTATQVAHDIAQELRRMLALPAPDPPVEVDAGLRPEGRQGPLVRSLDSYAEYYRRWGSVWERQALLRAVPVAGDEELGARFVALIDPLRYPQSGIDETGVREIRRLKARMEAERLPRGVDRTTHTKLGRGGLSDVEWTVQLLQLRHADAVPGLRVTATLAALDAAVAASLIDDDDARVLREAWILATRVRNAIVLARGRPSDVLPTDPRSQAAVARAMGYPAGHTGDLLEDYRRAARHARAVHERLFWS